MGLNQLSRHQPFDHRDCILVAGAIGEGGLFVLLVREFRRFLSESGDVHKRTLVRQALACGRYSLASLPDADVLAALAMVAILSNADEEKPDKSKSKGVRRSKAPMRGPI